ncbi:MAG: patatin-like phospholipase family protein [Bacteroidaceae bacterium]|nr:patatin-like phospholipase family protein [Bacteroidaceae bacterium]
MRTKSLLLILASIIVCATINAQEGEMSSERKKVGVVLSGGGAKGMAHIGVLKVLEKAGIPIDIITGTSMGSIVGGLYAIGYNSNALDSIVRMQDWGYVISDKENLSNQSISDRKKQNTYFISTGLTIGKNDIHAGGIIKGKNLAELFQRLCTGYTDSLDFSKDLRIPFACVATDIIDNSEVDFHSGRLPQAMRASMSIPGAFSPVRLGDMVLVDGGLKNNYPADIAKKMGADIIIGVTVQSDPKVAEDLENTISILNQIIDVNVKNKVEENLEITDLHLKVDTRGYSTASFSTTAIDSLIRRGEEMAMSHWDEIIALKQRIGIDESFRPAKLYPLRREVLTEKQLITGYTFENMTPQDELFIRQKFSLNRNDSIDAKLEQQLTTTMRVDLFYQTAECRLVPDGNGVHVILSAGERKTVQLYAGARFDTEEYAALQVGADIPLKTKIPINTDITVRLGKRMMTRAEITIHPRSFTRPKFSYTFFRNDVDLYFNGKRDYNILYNQFQAEFLPISFNLRNFDLQMGIRWDYMHYRNKLGSETSKQVMLKNEHFFSYHASINYNSEDNWYFPTRGSLFQAEFTYLTNDFVNLNEYAADGTKLGKKPAMGEVKANWQMSFPINNHLTIQPMLYGRLLFGPVVPVVFSNTIGGNWFGHYIEQQMPFAGIGHMEYIDNQFIAAQIQAQQRIGQSHYVQLRVAGGQQADKLGNIFDNRTLIGGQIAYYYNTMAGPLGATFGYSNHTQKAYFYVNLGFVF